MLKRSIVTFLIVASSFIVSLGQTSAVKKDAGTAEKAFCFSLRGGGSFLGVQLQEVNKENIAKFQLKDVRGVAVDKVADNSPAAKAGLRAGDVIVRFGNEEVTGALKLARLIAEVDPDHTATIEIIRGGAETKITATIGKRPSAAFENTDLQITAPRQRMDLPFPSGVDMQFMIKELARDLDLNVLFDPESFLAGRKLYIDFKNVSAAQALDYIFLQERLSVQKVGPRAILISRPKLGYITPKTKTVFI